MISYCAHSSRCATRVIYILHYRKVDKDGYHSIVVNANHNTPKQ